MKKYEDFYKDKFDKINLSSSDEDKIANSIFEKYTKRKFRNRLVLGCITLIFIGLIGIGIVYADEIEEFIKGFTIETKTDEKGNIYIKGEASFVKEMNYDADIPELSRGEKGNTYKIDELEKILNMKILKSNYVKTDEVKQLVTAKKENKIASAEFTIENFTRREKDDNLTCKLNIYFSTKYSENNTSSFDTSRGVALKKYYLKKLNTTATILLINHTSDDEDVSIAITEFIYDNVGYNIWFKFYPYETTENGMQRIKNILDSFS